MKRSGSVCKYCIGIDQKLFLKGSRCLTEKCPIAKKILLESSNKKNKYRVFKKKKKNSIYGLQIIEKRKVLLHYNIQEKFLKRVYFLSRSDSGITRENILFLLESMLVTALVRSGCFFSFRASRQYINHNKVLINNKVVNIQSYFLKKMDIITFKDKKFKLKDNNSSFENFEILYNHNQEIERILFKGILKVDGFPVIFNFQNIVDFYTR